MAQEQKQPRKSSETEEAVETAPETDVAERKEALDSDVAESINQSGLPRRRSPWHQCHHTRRGPASVNAPNHS